MKYLFFSIFSFFYICVFAQNTNQQCNFALESISNGYIQYGVELLRKTAASNNLAAQYYVAVCYDQGIGVEKNEAEAFKMYRKSAERGLPDAMYKMSIFYKKQGDATRSLDWLERYQKKGGKMLLPDITPLYANGLANHAENYTLSPNESNSEGANLSQSNGMINSNNTINQVTIVQQIAPPTIMASSFPETQQPTKSDVDVDLPMNPQNNDCTFAIIIANENYQDVAKVPNAHNDGEVFSKYCEKSLGIPKSNIHLVNDATLNNIKREVNYIAQVDAAYKGTAKFILYYAGHGLPDESTKNAYLLPVDGYGTDVTTCYSLNELYSFLGEMTSSQIVVFLDACFSGSLRGEGMLASARGVAIKAKSGVPLSKVVVLSAAQGDETAYAYEEQGHGLFTYFLLKKLKDSNGEVNLEDLFSYVSENVIKKSLVVNGKQQTPSVNPSSSITNEWKSWTLR